MNMSILMKLALGVLAILGCVLAGVAFQEALAQSLFQPIPRYHAPDMTAARIIMMVGSGAAGFFVGWFLSPQAREFRLICLCIIVGILILSALFDNGPLGWGSATFVSMILFAWGICFWIGRAAKSFFSEPPMTFGSAKWADKKELENNGLFEKKGFPIGYYPDRKNPLPMFYNGDSHLLTVAKNRAGKGTTMIVPTLLNYEGSTLVLDPKGENAMITAERRKAMGQDVYIVDPWGITGMDSARFNPLDWLETGDPEIAEKAQMLADALVVKGNERDPFWMEEAKALLQGMILYVATDPSETGQRHLGRVRDLLLQDGDGMKALYNAMLKSSHHLVVSTGARCLQKEDKLMANVIASAQAQTHILDSPMLRENLSVSDFNFADLKRKKMTVYLVLPSDRLEAFGRWLRLLIQQALTVNARNIEDKPDKPVLFMLDEMPVLGNLTMLEQAFGLMAGYGIQIWGICQNLTQLKRHYGDGYETFIANAGMIQYFGTRDKFTAEYFSSLCGVTTIWNFTYAVARAFSSTSGYKSSSSTSSTTRTETSTATQRKLANADELMRLHKSAQLVLVDNLNPVLGRRRPWFEDPALKSLGRNLYK
jgi:type IV secretion system protein VirD4